MEQNQFIAGFDEPILLTGAAGFIGLKVLASLLNRGFRNVRCFVRPSGNVAKLEAIARQYPEARVEIFTGNLLSREDCNVAANGAAVVYHLAAGRAEKSFPDAFINSVVTTRNLLEASVAYRGLRRFVNVSSMTVYTNRQKKHGRLLDENCPVESNPTLRGDAYCFAKVKQEQIVADYGKNHGLPYVIVRPGYVYGPGREGMTGRVGVSTFGFFVHLGGSNRIPFSYVDNCAEAITLAGLTPGIDGEAFNVVDDDLPTSRKFLRGYKRNVRRFPSVYVPPFASYVLCWMWERYSDWSQGQLPPAFNRSKWHSTWKKTRYSNAKLKKLLGWQPATSTSEGFRRYFEACRAGGRHA